MTYFNQNYYIIEEEKWELPILFHLSVILEKLFLYYLWNECYFRQNYSYYNYLHWLSLENLLCFSFEYISGHLFCVEIIIHTFYYE